ncbi:DUF1554 domain-containing protein [Candidatus Parcubacteria bacterium]|nr:DUF1554 domain-containing protein [Candidatus Parcubacteria bacterium]
MIKNKHITKEKSFTLIELLVSITIFVLVFLAAMGIFVSSLKGKQRVNELKEIEDNGRYLMESMSREIRMGTIPDSQSGNNDSDLSFIDSDENTIVFSLNANDQLLKNADVISSDRINISNLKFYVNDFLNNSIQPEVTISITIESVANSSVSMDFQNTVSLMSKECNEFSIPIPPGSDLKRVFVTSSDYSGALGGLNGGDNECQTRANMAGLGGIWKAWLSGSATDAKDRISDGVYYVKGPTESNIIAMTKADLIDGTIENLIKYDENGNFVIGYVWTGTDDDGTAHSKNCNDWTSDNFFVDGRYGHTIQKNRYWTDRGSDSCHWWYEKHLYCFEQ